MARLAVALVLGFIAALASGLVPPLISVDSSMTERGFPMPWIATPDYVGGSLPFIGWIFQTAQTLNVTYDVGFFVLDFAFFTLIFFVVLRVFVKGSSLQRRRVR